jgi:hypothetical protein
MVERGPSRPHERPAVDVDAGCETDGARLMSCLVLSRAAWSSRVCRGRGTLKRSQRCAARSSYSTSPRGRSPGRMRPQPSSQHPGSSSFLVRASRLS